MTFGNIEISEVLGKCELKADCGNVEINNLLIKEDSSIEADLGNIEIRGTNDIYIDSSVDLGRTNINKNNRNSSVTLKIKCDLRQCRNK